MIARCLLAALLLPTVVPVVAEAAWSTYYNCLVTNQYTLDGQGNPLPERFELREAPRFSLDARNGALYGVLIDQDTSGTLMVRQPRPGDERWAAFWISDDGGNGATVSILYVTPRERRMSTKSFLFMGHGRIWSGSCAGSGPDGTWFGDPSP